MNWEAYELAKKMSEQDRHLYNGKTADQIEKSLPSNWIEYHKKEYMQNVRRVIECQVSRCNLQEIEGLKNYNFVIFSSYLFNN